MIADGSDDPAGPSLAAFEDDPEPIRGSHLVEPDVRGERFQGACATFELLQRFLHR